jgi:phage terminase large subunit-like protein
VVRGPWTRAYLDEHAAFPTRGVPDDQVDASSGAFQQVVQLAQNGGGQGYVFTGQPAGARRRITSW